MSKLYFKIGADYDKVIRLRDEIAKLKKELLSMNQAANPREFARLERQLRQTSQEFENLVRQAALAATQMQNTTVNINHTTSSLGGMNSMLAKIGGTVALSKLASDIIYVRGAFQQLEMAFETMLKSKEKASALMAQIIETAAKTPFDLQGVTNGAKQLLAYGTEAKDVNDTLIRLGNIASGLSIPLGDMIYLYGTTQTQGRLFTQDVRQFMGRGIPLVKELSNELGKTEQQINEMVTAGKIGFPEVERVIHNMTNEGGQFYNLMERQSASLSGQISNLGDAWNSMLNEIGTQTQETASAGISVLSTLIENYEEVGVVLASLILGYGSYRTAIVIVNMLEKVNITLLRQAIIEKRLAAAANITLSNSMAIAAARGKMFASIQRNIISSFKGIGRTLTNPYVLFGAAVGAATYGLYKFYTRETEVERMQRQYNETKEAAIKHEEEHKTKVDELINSLENEVTAQMEQVGAIETLKQLYPGIIEKYIDEEGHLKNIIVLKKELTELNANKKVEQNKTELQSYDERIKNQEEYINRMHTNDQSAFDDEVAKLEELKRQRELSRANVAADYINKAISESKTMSDTDIANTIDTYQKALSSNKDGEWFDTDKEFKIDDIKRYISALKNLQTARANVVHNKEYWSTQKKEAEKVIESIASSQKKLMDAGKFDGIDSAIVESYKKNTKLLKEAEKELKVYDTSSKQESEAEKQRKKHQKSAEELLSLRRQNQQDEINLMNDGSDRKLKQIELDYQKELDAIKKQERAWSKEQGGKLTQEQSVEISTRYTNAESKKDKSTADIAKEQLKEEAEAMRDYLKDYGTFQQQMLAIAQEYAEKIKKAQEENNGAQVKLLEKQRDVAIQNKETEAIKANVDWVTVFGEFGGMFNGMIRPVLEEAKKYAKTDEFKNSDQASQNALIDAIRQMEKSLGGAGGLNFKKLGQDMQIYQSSLQALNRAKDEETDAIEKLKKAQENYEKALKSGTEEEKQAAKDARDNAQQNADAASVNVKAQTDVANGNQQVLTDTATNLRANMDNVTEGLSKLASGGLKNAFDGIIQATKGVSNKFKETADGLKSVPIIGWILSIIDIFKDGLSNLVGPLLDAIFNAISGILSDVLSGDIFITIGKSLRDGIGSILNSITFGGWNSWMDKISGSNAKEVQEAIDRLTSRNETLEKSIDRLSDIMDKTAGSKSISAYQQAFQYQQEHNANTLQIAREQARYSGSHHSWQKYMGWTDEQLQWARNNVDQSFSGTDSLWNLSPEQMRMLLSNADIYDQIKSAGKGGYGGRVLEKLEAFADNAEKLEGLTQKINESLMQVSFDGLRDSFLDSLMDMNKDAKEFSDDFSEYMQRALLNFSLGDNVDKDLKAWYDNIAKLMQNQNGQLTEQQLDNARKLYDDMVQKAMTERDKIAEITGYTGDSSANQESTKKGFAAASQDSIEELNGRFTALQIAGEEIKNQNIAQSQSLNILTIKADSILLVNTESRNIADEIRTIQVNSYLELQEIRENTGAIIKPIKDMAADIAEVKKNTSKL